MKLETDRLILRPFLETDLPHMIEYATRPEFYQYLPIEDQTEETIRAFFDERMDDQKSRSATRYTFAVALKENDRIVGTIRLEVFNEKDREADIGYALDMTYEGNGLMSEAVHQVFNHAFEALSITKIWATVHRRNEKSWKLLVNSGMHRSDIPRIDTPTFDDLENQFDFVLSADAFNP